MTTFFGFLFAGTALFVVVPINYILKIYDKSPKLSTVGTIATIVTVVSFYLTIMCALIEGIVPTGLGVACLVFFGGVFLLIFGAFFHVKIAEKIEKKKEMPSSKLAAIYNKKTKEGRNMKLKEICAQLADVEEMLDNGQIPYTYDKLMAAMKADHPVEVLDEILATIYYDVMAEKIPSLAKVKKTLAGLEKFQKVYNVDLKEPIKELKEYINEVKL